LLKLAISANIKLMKNKMKLNWNLLIIFILAVVFFIGTSSFNYLTQESDYSKWTSPDEAANYFFARRFSEGKGLAYFDSAALIGDNMVMPRSFRSDFGWLKPVSFLGIILIYGSLGMVLGLGAIPFLTPFLAALGIIIFYFLVKEIFSRRLAVISSFLLAFFPVYIYYTVRSLFHNVLFIVLLLFGIYLLVLSVRSNKKETSWLKIKEKNLKKEESLNKIKNRFLTFRLSKDKWLKIALAFLSGFFFGLASITRTSELIWLIPALFIAWIFYIKRFSITKCILMISGFFLAILPNIYFNQLLYSAPFYSGYNEMNRSLDDISQAGSGIIESIFKGQGVITHLTQIYHNIFYFGFDFEQSLEMAGHYIWEMFPFLSIVFLLGTLIILLINIYRPQKKYLVYFLIFTVISIVLIFYYGSWEFNDNPDPSRFTIGNSYTRYWLPIYLMMIPIAALAVVRFSRALILSFKKFLSSGSKKLINAVQILILILFAIISLNFVLYGSEEGLSRLYYNNVREKEYMERVFTLTEPEGIIITKYHDKFIFPQRRVIMGVISNEEILAAVSKLAEYYSIYYYNFYLNEDDVDYLNNRKLPKYNLRIELIEKINNNFGLYSLLKYNYE
jgi:4-amino-4-deoxy-L-arabinose transferase-like glycosyltransferase